MKSNLNYFVAQEPSDTYVLYWTIIALLKQFKIDLISYFWINFGRS